MQHKKQSVLLIHTASTTRLWYFKPGGKATKMSLLCSGNKILTAFNLTFYGADINDSYLIHNQP